MREGSVFLHLLPVADGRTVADRVADVLSESFREDISHEFRLGLLQGALQVALPDWQAQQRTTNTQERPLPTAVAGRGERRADGKPRVRRTGARRNA